ncbi:OmpA family protein [Fundidesulfovibrio terrae]|uniref:OmpA family protein n=1 Tax=Fundidesulfovibrio terrae TaxID=2922866 RepID=UPI001FB01675|nr:OmpA family protein [Fundidesulfovibrio terrae]
MLKLSQLRGRLKEEDEGTWFISLADLLTLLLCFFVLMLSVSQLDQERYKNVAKSMEDALKAEKAKRASTQSPSRPMGFSLNQDASSSGQLYPVIQPALPPQVYQTPPGPATQPPMETGASQQPKTLDELGAELGLRFAQDPSGVQVEKREGGYAVTLKGAVLFDRGSADLSPTSTHYLDSIATSLKGTPYKVTVEGHTDNIPIQSFLYPSNWELSAARASRVARYLVDHGVTKERIQVAGFADTRPVAPNDSPQGQPLADNQARNRRVVVLINP